MSDIRANTISNAAGTGPVELTKQSAAKAWINVNTSTNGIYSSFGVSSTTDLGTGMFEVDFTSNFSAEKGYTANLTGKMNDNNTNTAANNLCFTVYNMQPYSCKSLIADRTGTARSAYLANYTFHGDLA